jgi:Uma2 family endonuclease
MSTTTTKAITPTRPPLASPAIYRITVDEYERMNGVLNDERVELIDGYLVTKMGKNPPHVWAVNSLAELLRAMLGSGWCVRKEDPARIPDYDEPEPDVVVARGSRRTYSRRHPESAEIALVVEVSESTYDLDRGEKWAAYSKGRIPIYWIVNLVKRQVEVYTRPGRRDYRSRRDYTAGQHVPVIIDGVQVGQIAVDDLLL